MKFLFLAFLMEMVNVEKSISQAFKNYIVNYFKNGNNMRVTLKKDNFYYINVQLIC